MSDVNDDEFELLAVGEMQQNDGQGFAFDSTIQ